MFPLLRLSTALLALCLGLAWRSAMPAPVPGADLVLLNGRLITVDAHDSIAEALAVRAGRIVAVGSNAKIRALVRPATTVIDLRGRTGTPGLMDTHAHILEGGAGDVFAVPLSDAKSVAEIAGRVAERVKKLRPGEWLRGNGWDEGKLAEGRYVEARDLDAVSPANPVWLMHTTGHYGVSNSLALKLAGITAQSVDPPAGTIDRDAAGRPTGVLKEAAMGAVARLVPAWTPEERRAGILSSLTLMAREGMTSVKEDRKSVV